MRFVTDISIILFCRNQTNNKKWEQNEEKSKENTTNKRKQEKRYKSD